MCGDSLDLKEEMVEELFKFTQHVIYGDMNSSTMAEARPVKRKEEIICLPPYTNTASVQIT